MALFHHRRHLRQGAVRQNAGRGERNAPQTTLHYGLGGGVGRGLGVGAFLGVGVGLGVGVAVAVPVAVAVGVAVAVAVAVGVGVGVPPPGQVYVREPAAGGPALQKSWVKALFAPCTPETYSWSLPGWIVPNMMSNRLLGSFSIQADLKVRRLVVIGEIHRAPFDVKDAIRCGARHRSKDTAARCEV